MSAIHIVLDWDGRSDTETVLAKCHDLADSIAAEWVPYGLRGVDVRIGNGDCEGRFREALKTIQRVVRKPNGVITNEWYHELPSRVQAIIDGAVKL